MKNVVKTLILTLILLLSVSVISTFASEDIISSLVINSEEEREIDIVMDKGKMYLPCKYILKYFEIPFKENHADKSLSFKNTTIKINSCFINGEKQPYPVFFLKLGATGSQNEFFMSAEALSKILEKNITSDSSQLLAYIKTKEVSNTKLDDNPFSVQNNTAKVQAYDEITLPIQKGMISLDSVGVKSNMMSDSYSQIYKDSQSKMYSYSNNMQVAFAGKLNSGDYKVELGTNSYSKNLLSFSGLSLQYKNQYKNFDYLLGKPDFWDLGGENINFELMGMQLKDHVENNKITYRNIEGQVNPTSIIRVYINNDFEKELSTYGGYYSLKNVYYNGKVKNIKIDELLDDGTTKEVFNKEFKIDANKKNVSKRDFIIGVSGLQNRLWANNGYIYQDTTKKYVAGFKHHKDISDKLTFDNLLIADKIYSGSTNTSWCQSVLGSKQYLNYGTVRNLNALEGETYMGVLTYKNNDKMDSKLYFGGSNSAVQKGVTPNETTLNGLGYFLQYENNYQVNNNTELKGRLFAVSPNFYMAGSTSGGGGFMADKAGGMLSGNTKYKNVSLSGSYSKYKSNFGNYYEGGLLDIDEYNLTARAQFKKLPSLTLRINNKKGQNGIGEIGSNSYELSAEKKLKCFDIRGGIRKNDYLNEYTAEGYSSYVSSYSDIFTEVGLPIGKRFGNLTIGHDIVEIKSDETPNNYNQIKLSYSTPSIKGFNFNISTGLYYTGMTKGNDWGLGITKRLKSGSTVSLNYRYNKVPYYMIDNMYIPGSMRHSITVDFAELYGIGNRGLQAIGTGNQNKGYLQIATFLDTNQNGIKDKGEPHIENIPFKVENDSEILFTTKDGITALRAEDAGIHNVKIFEDELPTLVSCHNKTKPSRYIKIKDNSKTKIAFGLISTVGNINGSVTIKDEFNNILKMEDLVVSVLDITGKEINYSIINEDGTFSFSGLRPGKYVVAIDKELQDVYKIKPDAKSENLIVVIPPVYKNYVNIDNVNLNYKYEI